jgi:acetyl-CoA carboxylase carboxyl transferase subunit alpha
LKLTSADLRRFGIIDEIVDEPLGGAHRDPTTIVATVLGEVASAVERLARMTPQELKEARYRKYRQIGAWETERQGDIGLPVR